MKPTVKEIVVQLKMVLNGSVSREQVSTWAEEMAYPFMTGSGLSESDLYVWKCLDVVSGIDLKDSPTDYLHVREDIEEWINRFETNK